MNRILRYKVKLKAVTPVFIGSGEKLNKTMYVSSLDNKKITVADGRLLTKYLTENKILGEFTERLSKLGSVYLYDFLNDMRKTGRLQKIDLTAFRKYDVKVIDFDRSTNSNKKDNKRYNDVELFVKDVYGNPYIPGSSIKGALRTVLLSRLAENGNLKAYSNKLERANNAKDADRELKGMDKSAFAFRVDDADLSAMHGISISDSSAFSTDGLGVYQKKDYNIKNAQSLRTLPLYRECMIPGEEVYFDIALDKYYLDKIKSFGINSFEDIIGILNDYWNVYLEALPINRDSEKFVPINAGKNAFMLIGGGVGFHSKTVVKSMINDKQKRLLTVRRILHKGDKSALSSHRFDSPASPRTLKLAGMRNKEMLMGVAELEVVKNV